MAAPVTAEKTNADDASLGPLPALDDLVQRIPAATRELLDDLFRAKFVAVRRVPSDVLKK